MLVKCHDIGACHGLLFLPETPMAVTICCDITVIELQELLEVNLVKCSKLLLLAMARVIESK